MFLLKSKGFLCLLVVFLGFSLILDGCAPRSRVRHAKIGEDLEEEPEKAEVPAPPPAPIDTPVPLPTPAPVELAAPPAVVPAPMDVATPAPTPVPVEREKGLLIKHGDTLWDISAEPDIYGNAFLWPLLFRSNRDKILDPDLIYPKQELKIGKKYGQSEMDSAIENSKRTPPYEPHRKPRKELPLDY